MKVLVSNNDPGLPDRLQGVIDTAKHASFKLVTLYVNKRFLAYLKNSLITTGCIAIDTSYGKLYAKGDVRLQIEILQYNV